MILAEVRDNFTGYSDVRISRTTRERSFWRRWGKNDADVGAKELGRYGTVGPRTSAYSRERLAILKGWNTLKNQTRFRIRKGALLVEGPTAPKTDLDGKLLPGGGHQLFVPNTEDLFIP